MRNKSIYLVYLLALGVASIQSCSKKSSMFTKKISKADQDKASGTGALQLSLAEQITEDIILALKSDQNLTEEQVAPIRSGALAGISTALTGFNLAGTIDPNNLVEAAPSVIGGATKAMKDPAVGLTDDAKVGVAGIMTKAAFKSLNDKLDKVDPSFKASLPGKMTQAAVGSLDEAGIPADKLATGIGSIMSEAVANLDDAGFPKSEMAGVFKELAKASVAGMKDAGLTTKNADSALKAMMDKSVGALDEAGIPKDEIGSFVGPIISNTVAELDDFGFKASQVGTVMDDLMAGAVGALDDAGLSGASEFKTVMAECVKGAMEGMSGASVTASSFSATMETMMQGAVGAIDDLGIKDAASISEISANVVGQAVSYVDNVGIADATIIKEASLKMAEGTMNALGEFKKSGLIDLAATTNISAAVQAKGVESLKAQNDVFNFGSTSDLGSIFSEGIRQGLAEAAFSQQDIISMADDLAAAGQAGLLAANVDAATAEQAKTNAETSINSWAQEMQDNCVKEKGTWQTDGGGWCKFPLAAPVAGGSVPSPAEEDDCFNKGGYILYKPDGGWFCDSFGAIANSEADCIATGGFWQPDDSGTWFCDSSPPVGTQCYKNTTSATCQQVAGCIWYNNLCANTEFLSCANAFTSSTCSTRPGCMWNTASNYCENATNISCSGTSTTCSQTPGCIFADGICQPSANINCSANTTDAACTSDPGCSWDGSTCLNMQNVTCFDKTTKTNCQGAIGCIWDGAYCLNSAGIICSDKTTDPTCSIEPGCVWYNNVCQNATSLDCPSQTTSTSCLGVPGCLWDTNTCVNSSTVSCAAQGTEPTCKATAGCMWNSGTSDCINAANISCEGLTSATCPTTPGCLWDSAVSQCINSTFIDCSSNSTDATCNAATGCSWDSINSFCVASANLDCSANTTSPTCNDTSGCFWDSTQNFCANANFADCGSRSSGTCEGDGACKWDTATTTCQIFTNDHCNAYNTQATCPASDGCSWDSALVECKYEGQQCESFLSDTTCNSNQLCQWHGPSSGGSCHTDGVAFCNLSYGDSATCNSSPYCGWNTSTSICEYAGPPDCYSAMDSSSCSAVPGDTHNMCFWTGSYCQMDDSKECSNYYSSDSNACNNVPICNWNGSSCDYVGPTICEKIGNSSACAGYSDCKWDSFDNKCYTKNQARCDYLNINFCGNTYESYCSWNGSSCDYTGPVACMEYDGTDATTCNNQPNGVCHWDSSNSMCNTQPQNFCATSFSDQISCESWGGMCDWNAGANACEYNGPVNCSPLDNTTCQSQLGCYWKGGSSNYCSYDAETSCYFNDDDQTQCNNQTHCAWSGSDCYYTGPSICPKITNQSNCDSDPNCNWDNNYGGFCDFDMNVMCSSFGDQTSCQSDMACEWDTSTCRAKDFDSPTITALSFSPSTVDVSGGDVSMSVHATVTDTNGVDLSVQSDSCWRIENTSNSMASMWACGTMTLVSGDTYKLDFTVNQYMPDGTYELSRVAIKDTRGNENYLYIDSAHPGVYQYHSHNTPPTPPTLTVSGSTSDTTTPIWSAISFTSSTLNFSGAELTQSVIFTITDSESGILTSTGGGQAGYTEAQWTLTGTTNSSTNIYIQGGIVPTGNADEYRIDFKVSPWHYNDTWKLTSVYLYDQAGNGFNDTPNGSTYTTHTGITVPSFTTSSGTPDYTPIGLASNTAITFDQSSYNAGDSATLNVNVTGDTSGLDPNTPCATYTHQSGSPDYYICGSFSGSGGAYSVNFNIDSGITTGTYYLKEIHFKDNAGHNTRYQYQGSWPPSSPTYHKEVDNGGYSPTSKAVPSFSVP